MITILIVQEKNIGDLLATLMAQAEGMERAGAEGDAGGSIGQPQRAVYLDPAQWERLLNRGSEDGNPSMVVINFADDGNITLKADNGLKEENFGQPPDLRALVKKIALSLRQSRMPSNLGSAAVGSIQLLDDEHRVRVGSRSVEFSPTEYRLLRFFMNHRHRVFSRRELLEEVWGGRDDIDQRTVDVHVRRLRKILADYQCDAMIQTVRGIGYRFSELA